MKVSTSDRGIEPKHFLRSKPRRGIAVRLLAEDMDVLLANNVNISDFIRKSVAKEAKKYR